MDVIKVAVMLEEVGGKGAEMKTVMALKSVRQACLCLSKIFNSSCITSKCSTIISMKTSTV